MLFYFATFSSPFFFISDLNFGLFDFLLLCSFISLIISKSDVYYPEKITLIALLLIIFGYTISITNSWDTIEAIKFPLQWGFMTIILFPLVYTHIRSWDELYRHTVILVSALLIVVGYSAYYYFAVGVEFSRHRWTLFYGNPNTLAVVIFLLSTVLLFTTIYTYSIKGNSVSVYLLVVLNFYCVFLLVRTLSRRALVGMALVYAFVVVTNFRLENGVSQIMRNLALYLPIGGTLLYLIYALGYLPEGIAIRISETLNFSTDGSTSSRIIQHQVGIRSLAEYWLIGTGYNNFAVASNHAATVSEVQYMDQSYPRIHNAWLLPFVEGGLFAGIGMTIIYVKVLTNTVTTWISRIKPPHYIAFGYMIASSIFILTAVFGTLSNVRFYWYIVAISLASAHLLEFNYQ